MEGMPDGGPKHAAVFRAAEFKDAREAEMNRLAAQYKELQMKIIGFEKDIQKGDENMLKQGVDPEVIRISKEIRSEILYKLEDAKNEKEELERMIKERGGNPSDYTVQ